MYPKISIDENSNIAYLAFSDHQIQRSVESQDELFVFDIGHDGKIVGIEVLSLSRLYGKYAQCFNIKDEMFVPDLIPAYILPCILSSANNPVNLT
jgi:uncharacterized protein YuzE